MDYAKWTFWLLLMVICFIVYAEMQAMKMMNQAAAQKDCNCQE